ncbi:hypothetical protein KI387_035463, partial [Taxus chinensis]
ENCSYTLEVKTGKIIFSLSEIGAGTSNAVHVKFRNKTGSQVVKKHLNKEMEGKKFQAGKTDTFQFSGACLEGRICLLNFFVEGKDRWGPQCATVKGGSLKEPYTFHFRRHLPQKAWDGQNTCDYDEEVPSTLSTMISIKRKFSIVKFM